VQPSSGIAGADIAPAVEVTVQDVNGQKVTGGDFAVTVALANNPGGATLSGTLTRTAVEGVATFNDLSLDMLGTGYTITASATNLTGAISSGFNIAGGAPDEMAFTQQPTNVTAGAIITPPVQVTLYDAFGNVATSSSMAVTVSLASAGPGENPDPTLSGTTTKNAVNGVATFDDLSVDEAGSYELVANAGSLTAESSESFDNNVGSASEVRFTVQPTNAASGDAISPAVEVSITDAGGNVVTSATDDVTVAIGTNPSGGTLSGTLTVAAVNGVATFSDLSIDLAGAGYDLTASVASLTGGTSDAFDIGAGTPAQLAFSVQPTNAASATAISPAVTVEIQDANGNLVTTATNSVTLAIGTNPSGGTLSGTLTQNAVAGVATFGDLSIDLVGTAYDLTASGSGLTGDTSDSFDITAGTAAQLAFTVQPTNTASGDAISPAVQVEIRDAQGNLVPSATDAVTLAIGTNPSGGTLSGTLTQNAVAGVATFNDLSIDLVGVSYDLTASATGFTGDTSDPFDITPGSATQLRFFTQPSNTVAGAAISPAVQVEILDANNNRVTSASNPVTMAIGTNPSGGTLGGTLTQNAVNGLATFADLTVDRSGAGYDLDATSGALTGDTSDSFNVDPGSATQLAFVVQPTDAVAGVALSPAVQVQIRDSEGNLVSSATSAVTLAIGTNPGGGTLSGTLTQNAVGGVATFSDLSIDRTGTNYDLDASASGLAGTTSNGFDISAAAASQVAFSVQPSNAAAGSSITPAVEAEIQDQFGNRVPTASNSVTVAIGTNPSSGTLSGTLTQSASSGTATFSNLSIDLVGNGYTLTAASGSLSGDTSDPFDIGAGTPTQLVIVDQPNNTAAAASITPPVTVEIRDQFDNLVTSATNSVTMAIGTNPGPGTLSGTTTRSAVAGVATFDDLNIDVAATGYDLDASASGLTGDTSNPFDIVAGSATQLVFTTQPSNATAGVSISPAIQVEIQDAGGNLATTATNAVTLAIGTNPAGGTLSGTLTVNASGGIATFSNISIDKSGNGYDLTASAGGLTGDTSNGFNITAASPAAIVFTGQPSNTAAGQSISPAVSLEVRDAFDNLVTTATNSVSLAIGTNPGGSTLGGTTTLSATSGTVSFSNLTLDKIGTGYDLTATSTGLTGDTSDPFNITAAPASQLVVTVEPSNTTAGVAIAPSVQVEVRDAFDNLVSSATNAVTAAIGTNPGAGTLSGTTTQSASGGTATFDDLSIDAAAAGYTLTFSATGLTGDVSTTFDISAAAAAQVAFTTQPTNTTAGASITPAVQVEIQDAFGNLVNSSASVTVALDNNPGPGTLSGTLTQNASAGTATFNDLSVDVAANGYTLSATSGALTNDTSDPFNITAGVAAQLAIRTEPTATQAGSSISPAVEVEIQDASGNLVATATNSVAVAIGTNPGTGVLTGTTPVAAVAGVATFSDLSIDKTGTGYDLDFTSTGLTGTTSASFDITAAGPSTLVITGQPSNTTAGATISPAVTVEIRDAFDNLVTTATNTVNLSIGTNPGSGTLGGTTGVAAVAGVATFNDLFIQAAGIGYDLNAASTGLTGTTSTTFDISAAAAAALAFSVQPSNATAGVVIAPSILVEVHDAFGNLVTSASGTITMNINDNPGGGSLSGDNTKGAVSGVSTFDDLSIDRSGNNYTLIASAGGGITSAISDQFDIDPAAASQLVFTAQPTDAGAGDFIQPNIEVQIQDAFGNVVPSWTETVTMSIGTNPGGGTLSGDVTAIPVNGTATWNDLSIDQMGNGYTLIAEDLSVGSTITSDESDPFDITAGSPDQIAFSVQPSQTVVGQTISPSVEVQIQDQFGNHVTTATNSVTMAFGTNAGSGTLSGTLTQAASGGTAVFNNLSIDAVSSGYTLQASSTGLGTDESAAFDITSAAPTQVVFTVQPTTTGAGSTIAPAVVVEVRDGTNTVVTGASNAVTLAIGTNPGGGTLGGTTTVNATDGVATFSNLFINAAATGYDLTASSTGLTGATSSSFDITAGAASRFVFVTEPASTESGLTIEPAVQVAVQDNFGNTIPGRTDLITVAIGTNPGGGTLGGTTALNAVDGVATFSNLSITGAANGYTLTATGGLTTGTSHLFDIVSFSWVQVASGNLHSCAIDDIGEAYCWGSNTFGQLGDGSFTNANSPVGVATAQTFVAIDAAEAHTCALTAAGAVWCWGDNTFGQLGNGTNTTSATPVLVSGGNVFDVITAANHGFHTCGVTTSDAILCWGDNDSGQLGNGTTTASNTPVAITAGGLLFSDVSGGLNHTCAIATNPPSGSNAYCWGSNGSRQLGDGTGTSSSVPVHVFGSNTYATIEAGRLHSCALTTADKAFCWGNNGSGQIGDGTRDQRATPTAVTMPGLDFTVLSAGANHNCAISTDDDIYCWGAGGDGRLGTGSSQTQETPTQPDYSVSGQLKFQLTGGGQRHTCSISTGGVGWCWGQNTAGQIGDGTNTRRLRPTNRVVDP
jgi:alpha-tubulin suppressor-like RCC1 family protein